MAAPLDHLQSAFGEVMSEQPVSHSPLPWRVLNVTAVVSERDVRGPTIAQCWPAYDNAVSNANAEFIVRSCNAHHKLLTLAEKIVRWGYSITSENAEEIVDEARAALAKMEAE